MATRCFSPPLSFAGKRLGAVRKADGGKRLRPRAWAGRRRALRARRAPASRSRSPSSSGTGCSPGTRSRRAGAGSWRGLRRRGPCGRVAGDLELALGRRQDAAEDRQKRGLAAARGSHEQGQLAGVELEVDALQGLTSPAPEPNTLTMSLASRSVLRSWRLGRRSSAEHSCGIDARHFEDRAISRR